MLHSLCMKMSDVIDWDGTRFRWREHKSGKYICKPILNRSLSSYGMSHTSISVHSCNSFKGRKSNNKVETKNGNSKTKNWIWGLNLESPSSESFDLIFPYHKLIFAPLNRIKTHKFPYYTKRFIVYRSRREKVLIITSF